MHELIEPLEPRQLFAGGTLAQAVPDEVAAERRAFVAAPAPSRTRRGGGSDADIFGEDSRKRVKRSTTYPYSAVGRLTSEFDDAGIVSNCSGALISAYHFLTAAHCVYNSEYGGFADEITIRIGKNFRQEPYGVARYTYVRIPDAYTKDESSEYDYALVTLDRRVGDSSSWLGYASYSAKSFRNRKVFTAGYPADLGGTRMYRQVGQSYSASQFEILTKLDAAVGQSGSPVWVNDGKQQYVVGVLTSSNSSFTYLSRITSARFDTLDEWITEDNRTRRPKRDVTRLAAIDMKASTSFTTSPFGTRTIRSSESILEDGTSVLS